MIDFLGNQVNVGDTVLIPIKEGRTAKIGRGYVRDMRMGKQWAEGALIPQVMIEWSNIHKYWLPANRVVALPESMLAEKRREKLNGTEEAIQPS